MQTYADITNFCGIYLSR